MSQKREAVWSEHYLRLCAAPLGTPAALQRVDAETWSHQIRITVGKEFNI